MKILSGSLRGRQFSQPKTSAVRPLSDKVRAAIFDVYGNPEGKIVLDVYAGSGAAGFEAVSRGATQVEAIEASSKIAEVILANAKALGIDWGYTLHTIKLETWLALPGNQTGAARAISRYDLIIADPPYAELEAELLERLVAYLAVDGILVVSQSSKLAPATLDGAELVKTKEYGDTALNFYRVIV